MKINFIISILVAVICFGCREKKDFLAYEHFEFITKQEFIVVSPKSGDLWLTGESYEIKWIPSSRANFVSIELYRKNTLKKVVIQKTENDGIYKYTIPYDLQASNLYKIKIINFGDPEEFTFSDYFSIR